MFPMGSVHDILTLALTLSTNKRGLFWHPADPGSSCLHRVLCTVKVFNDQVDTNFENVLRTHMAKQNTPAQTSIKP